LRASTMSMTGATCGSGLSTTASPSFFDSIRHQVVALSVVVFPGARELLHDYEPIPIRAANCHLYAIARDWYMARATFTDSLARWHSTGRHT
jgi:hypothetical protein